MAPYQSAYTLIETQRHEFPFVITTDPRQGPLFKAIIAASMCDAHTARALHRFYAIRIAEWAPCVQQAINRGELPDTTDPYEVIRAVSAPLYYRLLTTDDPPTRPDADRAARAAATAARAGIYVRRKSRLTRAKSHCDRSRGS